MIPHGVSRDTLHLVEAWGLDCFRSLEDPAPPPTGSRHPFCLSCPSQVPEEMSRCRNSYTEQELKPLTLEALGRLCNDDSADYQHFLQDCVDSLFKEVKEKFKGWVSYSTSEQAELSYKKVSHILIFGHSSLVVGTWIH